MSELTPVSKAEQALIQAKTPRESKQVEALAAAAKAWSKEQNDFEGVVKAAYVYILARRKTTELIVPNIRPPEFGRPNKGNNIVTLIADYGFTKMQWQRRKSELNVPNDRVDDYIDFCIETQTEPTVYGLLRYSTNHHVSDDTYEWYTPDEYIAAARGVMGDIDLDPASSEEAQERIKAHFFYTKEDDGLARPWSGRVWLNPPYNMPHVENFIDKAIDEYEAGNVTQAIVLTNNSTDTGWFHSLISYPVCFTKGRIQFWSGDEKLATRQGQALFYLGDNVDLFARLFSVFGAVMVRYDDTR